MAKFLITPTTQNQITVTARLGGNAAGTRANDNDVGKLRSGEGGTLLKKHEQLTIQDLTRRELSDAPTVLSSP